MTTSKWDSDFEKESDDTDANDEEAEMDKENQEPTLTAQPDKHTLPSDRYR